MRDEAASACIRALPLQGAHIRRCSADVGTGLQICGKVLFAIQSSIISVQIPAQHRPSTLSMSGETANKAQGHLDAVNRAKNERLDRHAGEAVEHRRHDRHVDAAAVTVEARWLRRSSSRAAPGPCFCADHQVSFSRVRLIVAAWHAPAGSGVRGSPKKGELDAGAEVSPCSSAWSMRMCNQPWPLLWLMCHTFMSRRRRQGRLGLL